MKSFVKLFCLIFAIALLAAVTVACGCEHIYVPEETTEPTCTAEGVKTFTCSECGDSYTEPIAAKGHDYSEEVTAPTCTEDGYTTYTCACGDTYKDNTVAAAGHSYTTFVTAPTCTDEGYTTHLCSCGDSYTDSTVAATGVHTFVAGLVPLTEEQATLNPYAIGVAAELCADCGQVLSTSMTAVLVDLTFDEDIDIDTYEGSANYAKSANGTDAQRAFAAQVDSQKNLEVWKDNSGYSATLQDGKAVMAKKQMFIQDNLQLLTANAAVKKFTLTVDIGFNCDVSLTEEKHKSYFLLYSNGGLWSSFVGMMTGKEDKDPDPNVTKFELIMAAGGDASIPADKANTGAFIELGKEYTFKWDADAEQGSLTVSYKEVGAADFIEIGTYEINLAMANGSYTYSAIQLARANVCTGNTVDNLRITTELVK